MLIRVGSHKGLPNYQLLLCCHFNSLDANYYLIMMDQHPTQCLNQIKNLNSNSLNWPFKAFHFFRWKDDPTSVWRNPKSQRNRIRNFFPIPNLILFSIPNFSDAESDTFFETKLFRYILNLKPSKKWKSFETENFWIQNPILFPMPNLYDTESDTFLILNFSDTESETT